MKARLSLCNVTSLCHLFGTKNAFRRKQYTTKNISATKLRRIRTFSIKFEALVCHNIRKILDFKPDCRNNVWILYIFIILTVDSIYVFLNNQTNKYPCNPDLDKNVGHQNIYTYLICIQTDMVIL